MRVLWKKMSTLASALVLTICLILPQGAEARPTDKQISGALQVFFTDYTLQSIEATKSDEDSITVYYYVRDRYGKQKAGSAHFVEMDNKAWYLMSASVKGSGFWSDLLILAAR
tara:strand:+ start:869 stop:1207 length:339 start_codon:yes stop_codon:yes gene_type:complete